MNEQALQMIRERVSKATASHWFVGGKKPNEEVMVVLAGDYALEGEPDLVVEVWGSEDIIADALFIAHAPADVKSLLDEVEQLRGAMRLALKDLNNFAYDFAAGTLREALGEETTSQDVVQT
ncbi:hypothetical protein [Alicyclobacillus shizuokensis]|uniref:hypothetical protein n=1 Tax=Alicyclobacillus shizuokensis TaxID=392014 RepID=UPI000832C42D|nr:hypothetical protein [Alicyclobacillus shizuokensis]